MIKTIRSIVLSCSLILAFSQSAFAVPINGNNWMQVAETVNFTYNDLAGGPCNTVTGVCSGVASNHLGTSIDLTGWVWASSSDIATLFEYLTGAPDGTFDASATSFSQPFSAASWAGDFIDFDGGGPDSGLMETTFNFSSSDHWVAGLTRTVIGGNSDRSYIRSTGGNNLAVVGNPVGLDIARSHTGMWLFQPAAVSEPSILGLLLLSLGLLTIKSRGPKRAALG